jgi:hypothetical protein
VQRHSSRLFLRFLTFPRGFWLSFLSVLGFWWLSPSFSLFFFRFFFSVSLFFSVLLSGLSLFGFSFFFPPSPSSSQRSWALFIEAKGAVFYSSHGEQPAGRPLGAAAEVRWVVRGGWSAIVFGRWAPGESGRQKIKKKQPFFPSSPLRDRGKKMNSVVQNDTVLLFLLFFFFFECMKRRRFGENAPFHLNVAPKRAKFQISPQSSFFSSIASPPIRTPSLYLAVFFTLVLGL